MEKKRVIIIKNIWWDSTEDNYHQGEIGRSQIIMSKENVGMFDDAYEVITKLVEITGLPAENFYIYTCTEEKQHIEGDGLFDEDNYFAGDNATFIEQWKKGEIKAWAGHIRVEITFADIWEPSNEEMTDTFNFLKTF